DDPRAAQGISGRGRRAAVARSRQLRHRGPKSTTSIGQAKAAGDCSRSDRVTTALRNDVAVPNESDCAAPPVFPARPLKTELRHFRVGRNTSLWCECTARREDRAEPRYGRQKSERGQCRGSLTLCERSVHDLWP